MSDETDAALVRQIADGDERALAEVYERHSGVVMALSRRIIRNPSFAEEVVQEVFLRLWRQPERFDPARGSLRSYLLAQGHGRSIDVIRAETALKKREEVDGVRPSPEPPDVEDQVVQLDIADNVRRALDKLVSDERRAIELAYFGGHSYRETAALLGEPEGTTKSRIRSGMRRMRSLLAEDMNS